MTRVEELGPETFSVSKFHGPTETWVSPCYNGKNTFTTREEAQRFAVTLEEIERSGDSYQ